MKTTKRNWGAVVAALVLVVSCGTGGPVAEKTVNIGITDVYSTLNPLLQDGTEVQKYTTNLSFLPFVEIDKDLNFVGQLATSITTEDNKNFVIHLDKRATWSDGTPVTADDVVFTFRILASSDVGATNISLARIEGVGDDGFVPADTKDIKGVVAQDDKTVVITTKAPTALYSFENLYGRYVTTVPKHILKDVPLNQLKAYAWFGAPTVVSGPYFLKTFDLNHFATLTANDKYWKGAPKIKNLNFKVTAASALLAGLQSGEIDVVQQTTGNILHDDYETVAGLKNVTVFYGKPVTVQSVFVNTTVIKDARVRQAILYGIDRQKILADFLKGKGEVIDGFLASVGPYYDKTLVPVAYDPEKAKALLKEAAAAGWNPKTEYDFNVSSGDTTFVQVASYIAAQLGDLGLKLKVNTLDLSTLLSQAGSKKFGIFAVQYTYAPVDPYTDVAWLLAKDGWTGYQNKDIDKALAETQTVKTVADISARYLTVDTIAQKEVPYFPVYVISALGAVNNRVKNATPDVFGTLVNVQDWDVVQ